MAEMTDLAQRLAEFHQAAPSRADGKFADTEHLHAAVLGNLASLLSHAPCLDGLADLGLLTDWTHDALHDLLPRLRLREQLGFIRECHGDLHARNIVRWNSRLVPFDCLDFAPDLRWIDVMNDVAFLVMDLIAHERSDLSCAFLNRYLELTGDYDGLPLLPFYAVYRALVRAMVDSIDSGGSGSNGLMRDRMRKRIGTAVRFAKDAAPTLYLMHGPSGSGKSWLSERLIGPLNAVRVRSDVERKRLGGTAAKIHSPAPVERGIYDPGFTHRTYARLLECAGAGLEGGSNMLIDAAFLRREDRRMFEDLADEHRFALVIISCEADPAILVSRINARQLAQDNCSDADLKTLEWQLGHAAGLDDPERSRTVFVRTDAENCVAEALAAVRRAAARGIHLTSWP
jgi:predicted kinase